MRGSMWRLLFAFVGSVLLASCYGNVYGSEFETCDEVQAEIQKELASIQSCTTNAECGQVLTGTSCGCTNDHVARKGADTARFRSLRQRAAELECDLGASDCSCPNANGFVCTNGVCGWNYVN